jgi:hypothetical protein
VRQTDVRWPGCSLRMRREASKFTGMGAAKLYSMALTCLGKSKLADAYLLFGVAAAALCTHPPALPRDPSSSHAASGPAPPPGSSTPSLHRSIDLALCVRECELWGGGGGGGGWSAAAMGGGEAGRGRLVKCVQYRVATMLLMQIQLLRKSMDGAGGGSSGGGPRRVDDVMLETARLSRLLGGLTALDTTHRVIYMRVAVHHNLEVREPTPPANIIAFSQKGM